MTTPDLHLTQLFAEAERIVAETLPKIQKLSNQSKDPQKVKQELPAGGGRSPPDPSFPSASQAQGGQSASLEAHGPPAAGPRLPYPPPPPGADWKGATIFVLSILIAVLLCALLVR